MGGILLLGANGQVGYELRQQLHHADGLVALRSADLDLANVADIRRTVRDLRPALIINAAAYTAVEKAEDEHERALAINAVAPEVLAEEAKRAGGALVHYSTDFVFDGSKRGAYTEADAPNPLNSYGRSKLRGEEAIAASGAAYLIFRTSWVYADRGHNFFLTIRRLLGEKPELRVVTDQIGAPTWARSIATATCTVLNTADAVERVAARSGTYHMTCAGETSWFRFAETIADHMRSRGERVAKLIGITADAYPTKAVRPKNSVLDNSLLKHTFGVALEDWRVAFEHCARGMHGAPTSRAANVTSF